MVRDVDKWLEGLGLSRYSVLFAENEIDFEVLPELTEQDLKDLQIPLGHRKKLLKGIASLDGGGEPEGVSRPTAAALDATVWPGRASSTVVVAPQPRAEAERRQLTVMFCDLVDSTALSARLDPEDLREIIRAYQEACARAVAQYGGYVAKFMGDGVLVYFGYPQAHEDDGKRATRAALEIVDSVATLDTTKLAVDLRLSVRVGINTGPVVVGDIVGEGAAEEASVVGETPNVAARLQALAQPGQIVIGSLTRQIIGCEFELEDLGEKLLKGITEPVHAWRVLATRHGAKERNAEDDETGSPLVGRQEEPLQFRCWFRALLGNAYVMSGDFEKALGVARKALEVSTEIRFVLGVGWSEQVLGRVAGAERHRDGDKPFQPGDCRSKGHWCAL